MALISTCVESAMLCIFSENRGINLEAYLAYGTIRGGHPLGEPVVLDYRPREG